VVNGLRIDRRTVVRPVGTAQFSGDGAIDSNALQQIATAMALNNLLYA
jgi:hypothetical protein